MKIHTEESEISSTSRKSRFSKSFKVAPLSSTFFLASILGFFISIIYISDMSLTWGFTFSLIFILMFISSMISMTRATYDDKFLDHLSVHEPSKHLKHIRNKKN